MTATEAATVWRPLAREPEIVYEEPLRYRAPAPRLREWPAGTGTIYDQKRPPEGFRATVFRVAHERNVTIAGFRTFLTTDGGFFNDCTILPGFDPAKVLTKLAGSLKEGLQCDVVDGGIRLPDFDRLPTIMQPVVCPCSDEPSNYGSWLYRVLPKLISFRQHPVFVYHPRPWMKELLDFVFGDIQLLMHQPGTSHRLAEAYVPSLRNIGVYFDEGTLDFYGEVAERAGPRSDIAKLYLSRRGQTGKRPILNEQAFIDAIAEKGFVAVQPERLPIKEQIRLIRDAREIIVPGGSGLFNLAFARNAEHIVDIEPGATWLYAHRSLLVSTGHPYTIVFGRQDTAAGLHGPWTIDIEAVLRALSPT